MGINTQTEKLRIVSPVSEGDNQCGRAAKFFNSSSPIHYIVQLRTLEMKWKLQPEQWCDGRLIDAAAAQETCQSLKENSMIKPIIMLLKLYYNNSAGFTWQYYFIKDKKKKKSFEKHLFSGWATVWLWSLWLFSLERKNVQLSYKTCVWRHTNMATTVHTCERSSK